ncbi:MAG: hypothetical protein AB7P33_10810 [Dehalococcoidia bacterium]
MTDYPHNLRAGTDVYSLDGEKLGQLKRVVVKRSDLTLTHVVVDIGFRRSGRSLWEGGLGLDYDRILPIDGIKSVTDERVDLNLNVDEFKALPEYTAESYEPLADPSPNEFDVSDVLLRTEQIADTLASNPGAWVTTRLNKPVTSVDIVEGTDVWRQEPHEKLGDVKRLLVDADGKLQAVVISRGFILKHDVIVPIRYFSEMLDDLIRVELSDAELDQLKRYEEGD